MLVPIQGLLSHLILRYYSRDIKSGKVTREKELSSISVKEKNLAKFEK